MNCQRCNGSGRIASPTPLIFDAADTPRPAERDCYICSGSGSDVTDDPECEEVAAVRPSPSPTQTSKDREVTRLIDRVIFDIEEAGLDGDEFVAALKRLEAEAYKRWLEFRQGEEDEEERQSA